MSAGLNGLHVALGALVVLGLAVAYLIDTHNARKAQREREGKD